MEEAREAKIMEEAREAKIMEKARTAKTFQELKNMNLYGDTENQSDDYSELYDELYFEDYERRKKENIQKYGNIGTKNHYKVVRAVDYTDLEKEVNEYLEKGYNISGGLTIEVTKRQSIPDYFYQVVFRKGIEVQVLPVEVNSIKKKSKKSIVKRKRKTRKHYK